MHDLRQRHCQITAPTPLCVKLTDVCDSSLFALSIGVQNYRKKIKSLTKSDHWVVI
jgi:hypothetical protein